MPKLKPLVLHGTEFELVAGKEVVGKAVYMGGKIVIKELYVDIKDFSTKEVSQNGRN